MTSTNLDVLAYEETPLGALCLRRRELLSRPGTVVTEITLDHMLLMSSHHTDSERELARFALEMHGGAELDVLVGGLGLGYTAHEALASQRVRAVEVVELMPLVIGWLREGLVPLSAELQADARLAIAEGDVYARLAREPRVQRDLILVDVDHSPAEPLGGESGAFYSEDGLRSARRHLAPGGVLGVWSYAESSPFADALRQVFQEVRVQGVRFYNEFAEEEQTDWLFFARG
jgi:spermidine synthase